MIGVVYRELPELSRQYATRLVFLDHPLSLAAVNSWPQLNQRSQRWVPRINPPLNSSLKNLNSGLHQKLEKIKCWSSDGFLIIIWHTHTPIHIHTHTHSLHRSALSTLQSLKVVEQVGVAGRQEGVLLNQAFKSNIKCLLCGGWGSYSNYFFIRPIIVSRPTNGFIIL